MVPIPAVLCDLDGVVWLGGTPMPGAVDAVHRLRAVGGRVLFVTNNSRPRRNDHVVALEQIGIEHPEVLTSSMACGLLVRPGERVLLCGGVGLREAVEAAGAQVVAVEDAHGADSYDWGAVVVGINDGFDYTALAVMTRAIRGGARLVGANTDRIYPTTTGPLPGGGSLLAAVAHAGGVDPTVAGKPHDAMAQLVEQALGSSRPLGTVWMFGDQDETDGRFAERLGCKYARIGLGGGAGTTDADLTAGSFAEAVDVIIAAGWPDEG